MTLHKSVFIRKILPLLLFLFVCLGTLSQVYSASRVGVRVGSLRFSPEVKSLAELRWKNLTRQGWDMSCGAAALSTLLIYHHGRQFSEMAVTLTILKNSDPALVRERGGFSLYDLKRFVRAVGLEGVGYGEMTLDDLELFGLPAILPVRIGDFDHFVVFRKRVGGHVFLGDPSFGNISFPVERFERMWESRIAFFVINSLEKEVMARFETAESRSPLSPELTEMALPDVDYATRILSRLPILPLTRRMISVAP
jgi:hypothetical protein